jgi:hypothetical protein
MSTHNNVNGVMRSLLPVTGEIDIDKKKISKNIKK